MCIPILFIHSPISGYVGCFHFLAIVNNAAMKVSVQITVQVPAFNLLDMCPEVELLVSLNFFKIRYFCYIEKNV